jgi:iron complex outermembrane receptor protein
LLGSLTTNFKLADGLTLTSVTGYLRLREAFTANFNENGFSEILTATKQRQRQFTQEVRLVSSFDSPINFIVGGFYQNANLAMSIPATLPAALSPTSAPLLIANDDYFLKTRAYSVFGQVIWKFAEQWELAGGARYSHEKKSERVFSVLANTDYRFVDPERTFNNLSPEVTLSYRPSRNLTLFGAYRQGFTSGGFNQTPLAYSLAVVNDNSFKQSTVRGGEIGAKGTVANRQISFDITAYNYDYRNLQLQVLDATTLSLTLRNAGSARTRGVEFSTTVRPDQIRGLSLRASIAYNDARYTSFVDAQCYAGQTISQGCSGNVNSGTGVATTQNLSGTRLERAPAWSINPGISYEHTLGDNLKITFSGDAYYTGEYFSETTHDPRAIQHEAWRYNASIGLSGRNDGWEIALIGKNLTNILRAEQSAGAPFTGFGTGTNGPSLGSDLIGVAGQPRTIVLQLTLRNSLFQ